MSTKITYVFDDVEVKMTGRIATRNTPSGRTVTLYEITPVDSITVGSWKKWVEKDKLFIIGDNNE